MTSLAAATSTHVGVMSSRLFLIVNSTVGDTGRAFMDWGWRRPFLFSAVLIIIALYLRLTVADAHSE